MSLKCNCESILRSINTFHISETKRKTIKKLCEKQIPKKPKIMNTTLVGEKLWWYCGHCGASRHTGSKSNYCSYCGGKVDWD